VDINDIRSAVTVVSLLLFIAISAWVWQRKRRPAFDEAAQLPFADDATQEGQRS
jgi:cytochrome c oxidase cbb3-type subunit 4